MKEQFNRAILMGVIIIVAIAIFDILAMNSGIFGSPSSYMEGNFPDGWWFLFRDVVFFLFIFAGIYYYFVVRKDKSEALAISLVPYILWRFGLADLLFFWLQLKPLPSTLPWLNNHIPIGLFGTPVIGATLILSILVGSIVAFTTAWFLRNKL